MGTGNANFTPSTVAYYHTKQRQKKPLKNAPLAAIAIFVSIFNNI
jgi:hypothetical protein